MGSFLDTLKEAVLKSKGEIDAAITEIKELSRNTTLNKEVTLFLNRAQELLTEDFSSLNESALVAAGSVLEQMKLKLVEIKEIVERS